MLHYTEESKNMVFNRFRIAIAWRVILLALTVFLFFLLLELPRYRFSAFIIGLLFILEVILLVRFVERTNRKLTRFFESIRYADFSSSFSDPGLGKSFEDLSREFNLVIDAFRKYRTEKEEHFNYLQTVIQHVSIGIIVFKKDGKVEVFNQAMSKMLKIRNIRNISDLDDPEPADYKHGEFYFASQYIHSDDAKSATLPHLEFNYGVLPNMHLHLIAPFQYVKPEGEDSQYGYGDTELGIKYRFIQETDKIPMVGTFPIVLIPTGDQKKRIWVAGRPRLFLPFMVAEELGPLDHLRRGRILDQSGRGQ